MENIAAERGCLAGIVQHGADAYIELSDIISEDKFSDGINQLLWKCIDNVFSKDINRKFDYLTLVASAQELGLEGMMKDREVKDFLKSLKNCRCELENIRSFGIMIFKAWMIRELKDRTEQSRGELEKLSGAETIDSIITTAESPILDFTNTLNTDQEDPLMGGGAYDYIKYLGENQRDIIGISTGYPNYDMLIGGGLQRGDVNFIAARMKVGKALTVDSLFYTPDGPKRMGDAKVGDEICRPNGEVAKIIGVYPQGIKDVYEITTKKGYKAIACGEHLWTVQSRDFKPVTITTLEMKRTIKSGNSNNSRWRIQVPNCHFNDRDVVIPPYILGVLLGDGCIVKTARFTSTYPEIVDLVKSELTPGYVVKSQDTKFKEHAIIKELFDGKNGYIDSLRYYHLLGATSHTKFIPDDYLYNNYHNRLSLIQGLMDTDGSVTSKGTAIEYSTTSKRLAKDIRKLVSSIGGIATINERLTSHTEAKKKGIYFKSYRLLITHKDISKLFRFSKKKDACVARVKYDPYQTVETIEYAGKKECVCIRIDSEDGLFITDDFIVTHNSTLADNVSLHISGKLNIPVLQLDTEMRKERHQIRIAANLSEVSMNDIKNGKYYNNSFHKDRVLDSARSIEKMPFYYKNIAGMDFKDVISYVRRWIIKDVGLDENGKTKDCVLIYDYFKLCGIGGLNKNTAEHQLLGFQLMELINLILKYDISCLAFGQQNRQGIETEDTGTIAGSDRIAQYVGSISIYQRKSPEEIAEDGPENGNRKLRVLETRDGTPNDFNDWINLQFSGAINRIRELSLRSQQKMTKAAPNGFDDSEPLNIPNET